MRIPLDGFSASRRIPRRVPCLLAIGTLTILAIWPVVFVRTLPAGTSTDVPSVTVFLPTEEKAAVEPIERPQNTVLLNEKPGAPSWVWAVIGAVAGTAFLVALSYRIWRSVRQKKF